MERAVLVLVALLVNAALAGPGQWYAIFGLSRLYHYPATLIRDAERKLNREHRSLGEREQRGLIVVIIAIIASLIVGGMGGYLFHAFPDLGFIELLIVTTALPVRPTWERARHISKSLRAGDLPSARQALDGTVWRHHALMDDYGVARAAIEMLAVHFSEKILAPSLAFVFFGLPGLFISKIINLLQETLSQPGATEQGFGKASKTVHYVLHYVPARIACLFWVLTMPFLPSAKPQEAIRQIREKVLSLAPQALSLLSAASVLGLSLGGPTSAYASEGWYGNGSPRPIHTDIKRALYLFALLHLFLFLLLGLFL